MIRSFNKTKYNIVKNKKQNSDWFSSVWHLTDFGDVEAQANGIVSVFGSTLTDFSDVEAQANGIVSVFGCTDAEIESNPQWRQAREHWEFPS